MEQKGIHGRGLDQRGKDRESDGYMDGRGRQENEGRKKKETRSGVGIKERISCTRRHVQKSLTGDRTDHFAAVVTYSQFPFQVFFSSTSASHPTLRRTWFSKFTFAFDRKRNLFLPCPLTMTYTLDQQTGPGDGQDETFCQISTTKVIQFERYCVDTGYST